MTDRDRATDVAKMLDALQMIDSSGLWAPAKVADSRDLPPVWERDMDKLNALMGRASTTIRDKSVINLIKKIQKLQDRMTKDGVPFDAAQYNIIAYPALFAWKGRITDRGDYIMESIVASS